MFSTVFSAALRGMDVEIVRVEADTSNGLPIFHMVGYLSSEVKEAGERVKTAIRNSGYDFPPKKTVINLSPADIRKRGASFDLPIAVAVLISIGAVRRIEPGKILMAGELGLDGAVRGIPGVLPIVDYAVKAGYSVCIVPQYNAVEGAVIPGIQVIGAVSLREVCEYLNGTRKLTPAARRAITDKSELPVEDFADVHGQVLVKRASEIAAAGGHNLLMVGPPGAGKTMIARRLPGILPPMTHEECLAVTKIYSISGLVTPEESFIVRRPFREVHHTVSSSALLGGGYIPKPGEATLASSGILFLDELTEFGKHVLESLRQPLESKKIRLNRMSGVYSYPADFMLVAAMNPCPCGHYPDLNKCSCTAVQVQNYLSKISQPFLDRMDLCVEVERVKYEDLAGRGEKEESSIKIRERVLQARERQSERFRWSQTGCNAGMTLAETAVYCELDGECRRMMEVIYSKLGLTARTYYKILKIARTIADLEQREAVEVRHLQEAAAYRTIDRKFWGKDL